MASAKKISAKIVLDGAAEFNKNVKACDTAIKAFKSELNLVSTQYKTSANTLEALKKKQEAYSKIQEEQSKKVKVLKTALEDVQKSYDKEAEKLEKANKAREKAQKDLDDAKKKYGENSKEVKELEKVLEDCNKAYNDQAERVQKAGNTVNDFSTKVDKSEKELIDTNNALEETNKYLSEAEKSYDGTAKSIDEYGKEVSDAKDETKEFGITLSDLVKADIIASSLKSVAKAIVNVSKEAAQAAIEVGSNFEAQMSKVQAISNASEKDMQGLTEIAKKMGSTTKFTATEAGEGLEYMAMAGWDANQSIAALPAVLNLAAAAGEDLGTTSDIVTDAMTAFGLKADEASHFSDVLAATATNANTTVSMMGETFKVVAPIAGTMGYSIEDMSISIGLMANAGIKASQAGTDLRSIITRLSTDAGASSTKLGALGTLTKKLGVEFFNADGSARGLNEVLIEARSAWAGLSQEEQINYGKTIAGQRALSSWTTLMNASEADINKVTKAINNCSGSAEKMANTMNDNLKGKITIMNSALEGLGIAFYEKFETPMKKAVEAGTDGIDRLSDSLKHGELGDSVENLADSVGNLTEKLIDNAETALPKFIDGLTWVIDNGGNFVPIIEGAAAALIAYKTATAAAEIAQKAFNITANANPYIALATALAAGTAVVYDFVKSVKDGSYMLEQLDKETRLEIESSKKLNDNISKSVETRKQERESMTFSAEAAQSLVSELENLSGKYDEQGNFIKASAEEQARMAEIVAQLNSVYPELGLAIDEETGQLNMNTDAIRENIDAQLEIDKVAAAREHMAEIAKEQFEAEKELHELEKKAAEAAEEKAEAIENLNKVVGEATEFEREFGVETANASAIRDAAAEKEQAYKDQIEETKQTISDLSSEYQMCNDYIGDTTALDGAAAATGELASAAGEAGSEVSAMSEAVQEAYDAMQTSIEESIQSSMSIFEQFKAADKVNSEEMIKNVESQIQGYRDWGDSFDELASRTDSKHQEILGYLADLGVEGKGYIDALVSMNDVDFSSAMDKIQEALTIPSEVSTQIADSWLEAGENAVKGAAEGIQKTDEVVEAAKTAGEEATDALTEALDEHSPSKTWEEAGENAVAGLVEGMKDTTTAQNAATAIGKSANDAIDKAITRDQYIAIGKRIPEGLAQGIKDGQSSVVTAATDVATAAIKAAKETLGINSPSKVFAEIGGQSTAGFVEGWNSSSSEIGESVDATMSELSNTSVDMTSVFSDMFRIPDGFGNDMTAEWSDIGKNITSGIKQGITESQETLNTTLTDMAKESLQTITTEWEIAPTSKKFRDQGENGMKGLTEGIRNQKLSVTNMVSTVAQETITTLKSQLSKDKFVAIGKAIPEGLEEGIKSGKSGVVNAAIEIARAAAAAAKAELDIHSPSGVFKEIGYNTGAGFIVGLNSISDDMIAAVNETMGAISKASAPTLNAGMEANGNFPTSGINEINQEINIYSNEGGIIETARKFKESMMEAALAW